MKGNEELLNEVVNLESTTDDGSCIYTLKEVLIAMEEARKDSIESIDLKKICTDFYFWWTNQPGTNTYQGFDQWVNEIGNPLKK